MCGRLHPRRFGLAKNAEFLRRHRNPDQIAPKENGYSVFVLMKDPL